MLIHVRQTHQRTRIEDSVTTLKYLRSQCWAERLNSVVFISNLNKYEYETLFVCRPTASSNVSVCICASICTLDQPKDTHSRTTRRRHPAQTTVVVAIHCFRPARRHFNMLYKQHRRAVRDARAASNTCRRPSVCSSKSLAASRVWLANVHVRHVSVCVCVRCWSCQCVCVHWSIGRRTDKPRTLWSVVA